MARPQNLLTNLKVANAKCPEGQTKIVLSDGGNLYLEKRRDGGASWIVRLTLKGQKLWRSLGTYPRYSLKEAREMASEYLKQLQSGKDPLVDKRSNNDVLILMFILKIYTYHFARESTLSPITA